MNALRKSYSQKPRGWVVGYQCRGKYRVWGATGSRYIPKSVEFVDLVVPEKEGVTIPLTCEARKIPGPGFEKRLLVKVPKEDLDKFTIEL